MNKLLLNILPKAIKRKISSYVLTQQMKSLKQESNALPKYEIQPKNIENGKLLVDRGELLKLLPKSGVVAEIGVDKGGFSEMIQSICTPKKLHLIDFWGSDRYNESKRKGVEELFEGEIKDGKIEIHLGLSTEVVDQFQDQYFDWIYIDTDHSYKTTLKELELWSSKVKEEGIIAGHDYIVGSWNKMQRYGVQEAVYEFCHKYDWEIIYLTMEIHRNPSFAIRKINKRS